MRTWIAVLLCLLLALSAPLFAQDAPGDASSPPAAAPAPAASEPPAVAAPLEPAGAPAVPGGEATRAAAQPELTLVGRNDGGAKGDYRFRLGESVEIRVTGDAAGRIEAELAKSTATRVLTLEIDDVPMIRLPLAATTTAGTRELRLHVQLFRDPNDDDNRDAWDALLRKQDGYSMEPPLALAIGSEPAQDVASPFPFQLYVAPRAAIGWTLAAGLLLFVVAFYLLVRSDVALRDARGGSYSLGKSQMAFWGLLVVLTFIGVWLLTDTMERIPPQVLILLGISGATGLGSILIGAATNQGAVSKLDRDSAAPRAPSFWRDICDGGEGGDGLSIHRLQVVVWTLVLGAVFVRAVAQAISMPEFSQTLLILMGISNGTYLGFKIPEAP